MTERVFQTEARVLSNKHIALNYYKIVFSCVSIAKYARPGHFVQVMISGKEEAFLRRPFSIHKAGNGNFTILYEALGKGTGLLSQIKSGARINIIGPLGNGFEYQPSAISRQLSAVSYQPTVIVAGGMGTAPLLFLAEKITGHKVTKSSFDLVRLRSPQVAQDSLRSQRHRVLVLIGAKSKNQILCEDEFKKLGCVVKIATDDGSRGFKGKATELLEYILRNTQYAIRNTKIYACGPKPMLKEISRISSGMNISAQVSMEEHMACGIGACLGCVVDTKTGYRRVCKDGPVFNAEELIWK